MQIFKSMEGNKYIQSDHHSLDSKAQAMWKGVKEYSSGYHL